jgi:hypothetical protein
VKKVVKKIKKPFGKLLENPVYGIAAILVLVLIAGGAALLLLTGDDDKGSTAKTTTEQQKKAKKDPGIEAAKKRKVKPAPVVNQSGTLDVARSEGRLAVAQARGRIKNPAGVSVRVSAAPKQMVTVAYQISCYKPAGTRVSTGRYRVRPPNTRSLPLPLSGAKECTATVSAQLTRGGRNGRVKVAVVAG